MGLFNDFDDTEFDDEYAFSYATIIFFGIVIACSIYVLRYYLASV